jgi:hypothetical protein
MRKELLRDETGAVGWLIVGILIGIFLVFYAVFALILLARGKPRPYSGR